MTKRFLDKVAVVTGASSGIGRAVATRLSAEGATVVGLDCDPVGDVPFELLTLDVVDQVRISQVFAELSQRFPALHALVNAAGVLTVGPMHPVSNLPLSQWDAVLRVNLTGAMLVTKHAHAMLKAAGGAAVVNVSSHKAQRGHPFGAPYLVSKAGIEALTRVSALEMAAEKIRVNAVAPGVTRTGLLRALGLDEAAEAAAWERSEAGALLGAAEPEDVAGLVTFLLSDEARRITGEVVLADSGQALA